MEEGMRLPVKGRGLRGFPFVCGAAACAGVRTPGGLDFLQPAVLPRTSWDRAAHEGNRNGPETNGKGIPTMPDRPARTIADTLVVSFATKIPTEVPARVEHCTTFNLTLRGERLSGPVHAESQGYYFWLPSYASLRREQGVGPTQPE